MVGCTPDWIFFVLKSFDANHNDANDDDYIRRLFQQIWKDKVNIIYEVFIHDVILVDWGF